MPTENRSSNTEQMVKVPLKLTEQQARDIQRFYDTCEDGQGYDVPKDRMKSLARLGLTRSLGFGRYELTDAGDSAVNELRAQPAAQHQGDPDRALKDALFACLAAGGDDREYGGVATAGDRQGWVRFTTVAAGAQHQGEPVAFLVHGPSGCMGAYLKDPTHWAHGYRVEPLYTQADPNVRWKAVADEQVNVIDALRADLESVRASRDAYAQNAIDLRESMRRARKAHGESQGLMQEQIDALRARLAEREAALDALTEIATGYKRDLDVAHALLRRCLLAVREQHCDEGEADFDLPAPLLSDIDAALSASAEPKCQDGGICADSSHKCTGCAPVERDERKDFEADWAHRMKVAGHRERANAFYRIQPNDRYRWNDVQDAWDAWQARAAMELKL